MPPRVALVVMALALAPPAAWALPAVRVQAYGPPALARCAAVTPDRLLWVGMQHGLRRFDGRRFTDVGAPDAPGALEDADVLALAVDGAGALWAGTARGDLYRVASGRVAHAGHLGGAVGALAFDGGGRGWAIVQGRVVRVEGGRAVAIPAAPAGVARQLWRGRDGAVWIEGTAGWARAAGDAVELRAPPLGWPSAERRRRAELAREIVAGGDTPALAAPVTEHFIEAAALDARGRLWMGSEDGLFLVHGAEALGVDARDGLPDSHVHQLVDDGEGGVWVITHGGGLARAFTPLVAPVGVREGLAGNTPFAVDAAPDGSVWAGTVAGLSRIRGREVTNVGRRPGFVPGLTRSVLATRDGAVLVTAMVARDSARPLLRYWPAEDRFEDVVVPGLDRTDDVTALVEESPGRVLVATASGALARLGPGGGLVRGTRPGCAPGPSEPPSPCREAINTTAPRRAGGLWLGTFGDGLWTWDGERASRTGLLAERHVPITALLEDADGALWVGSEAGMARVAGGAVSEVPVRDGGRPDSVYAIVDDLAGHLWLGLGRGIARTTRAALLALAGGARDAELVRYTAADGLTSDMTMGWFDRPAVRGADGRLWFVNVTGLTVVDPAQLAPAPAPVAFVDEVDVAGRRQLWPSLPDRVRVDADERDLRFGFGASAPGAAHRVRFRYRLDGVDRAWVDAGDQRQVRYLHLAPGRYVFRVSAGRDDAPGWGPDARLAADLAPRFVETRAFVALVAGALALAVWLALRLRARQVAGRFAAVMNERERIGHDLHDTLAQVFSAIGFQVDSLERAAGLGPAALGERTRRLRQMVAHGRHAARAVIANLRARPGDGAGLERAFDGLAALYDGARIAVTVTGTPYPLGWQRENEVARIVEQAVSNAVEHGGARHIGVELTYEPGRFCAWVRDDGQGFAPDAPADGEAHFGLRGMRERAARAGGRLRVESCPGAGTELGVEIEVRG